MLTACKVNGAHSFTFSSCEMEFDSGGGDSFFWPLPSPEECLALSEVINIYMYTYMKYQNLFAQRCDSDSVGSGPL